MKLRCAKPAERVLRILNWRRWFAWYPVKVAPGDCRWLEVVERRIGMSEPMRVWVQKSVAVPADVPQLAYVERLLARALVEHLRREWEYRDPHVPPGFIR